MSDDVAKLEESASKALDRHDYAAAVSFLRRATMRRSNSPRLWTRLADALSDFGLYSDAVKALGRALRLDPTYASALSCLGRTMLKLGRPRTARAAFQKALLYAPTPARHVLLGEALWQLDDITGARLAYETAVSLDSACEEAWYNLGLLANGAHNWTEAIRCFRMAIRYDGAYAVAYREMGHALIRMSDFCAAEAAIRSAIRLNAADPVAHASIAIVLEGDGRLIEAEAENLLSCHLDPTDSTYARMLGDFYWRQGRFEEAVRCYRNALQIDMRDTLAQERLDCLLNDLVAGKGREEAERVGQQKPPGRGLQP